MKYPPKPIPELKEGYYWLKNYSDFSDEWLYRPVMVYVFDGKDKCYYRGKWVGKGTFVSMIGTENLDSISYFESWQGIEFIPLEEPKG